MLLSFQFVGEKGDVGRVALEAHLAKDAGTGGVVPLGPDDRPGPSSIGSRPRLTPHTHTIADDELRHEGLPPCFGCRGRAASPPLARPDRGTGRPPGSTAQGQVRTARPGRAGGSGPWCCLPESADGKCGRRGPWALHSHFPFRLLRLPHGGLLLPRWCRPSPCSSPPSPAPRQEP